MFAATCCESSKNGTRATPGSARPETKPADSARVNPIWQSLATRSGALQPKLTIGQADDQYEREADRVADQVMRMSVSQSDGDGLSITPVTTHQAQRKCAECDEEEAEVNLQRKEIGGETPAIAPPTVHQALISPGQPLDAATRAYFEPRFGRSFADVRLHTDGEADAAARGVSSHAFTVGNRIAFAAGQFAPHSETGRRLLAHELTHTLQQAQNPGLGMQRSSAPRSPASRAGGCSWGDDDEAAKEAGTLAHLQIQDHVQENFQVEIEGKIPRANKGESNEMGKPMYVGTECPPPDRSIGKVDLYYSQEPVFRFAEIKSFQDYRAGIDEYAHYKLRLEELESRFLAKGECREQEKTHWSNNVQDITFDREHFNYYLHDQDTLRFSNLSYDDNPIRPMPLDVPSGKQPAGEFKDRTGEPVFPRDKDGNPVNLHYENWMNGVVVYECRREREKKQDDEDGAEGTSDIAPSEQLTLPFLRDSDPLLDNWLSALETQPIPEGSAYAVAVSAPIFNALKFGASGQLPYSRDTLGLEAAAEVVGEVFGIVGLALIGGGLMLRSSAPARAPVTEAGRVSASAAEGQLGSQATGRAADALRQKAIEAGRTGSGAAMSAVVAPVDPENVEPVSSSLTPSEARSETALGRHATSFIPVITAIIEPTPDLYFAKTGAEKESGIPPPFTSAEQPDALGQLAWEAVEALVPYAGPTDVASLRELGLLRNAVLYANPAVIAVYEVSPEELHEIGALRYIDGYQYIIIANYVGL
jgi:hypothetical protein